MNHKNRYSWPDTSHYGFRVIVLETNKRSVLAIVSNDSAKIAKYSSELFNLGFVDAGGGNYVSVAYTDSVTGRIGRNMEAFVKNIQQTLPYTNVVKATLPEIYGQVPFTSRADDLKESISNSLSKEAMSKNTSNLAEMLLDSPKTPELKEGDDPKESWVKSIADWRKKGISELELQDFLDGAKAYFLNKKMLSEQEGLKVPSFFLSSIEKIEKGELPGIFEEVFETFQGMGAHLLELKDGLKNLKEEPEQELVENIKSIGSRQDKDEAVEAQTSINLIEYIDSIAKDDISLLDAVSRVSGLLSNPEKVLEDKDSITELLNEDGALNAEKFEKYYRALQAPAINTFNLDGEGIDKETLSFLDPVVQIDFLETSFRPIDGESVEDSCEKALAALNETQKKLDADYGTKKKQKADIVGYRIAKTALKVQQRALDDVYVYNLIEKLKHSDEKERGRLKQDVLRYSLIYPRLRVISTSRYGRDLLMSSPEEKAGLPDLESIDYGIPGLKDGNPITKSIKQHAQETGVASPVLYIGLDSEEVTEDTPLYSMEFGSEGFFALKKWDVDVGGKFRVADQWHFLNGQASFHNDMSTWSNVVKQLMQPNLFVSSKPFEKVFRELQEKRDSYSYLAGFRREIPASIETRSCYVGLDAEREVKRLEKAIEDADSRRDSAYETFHEDNGVKVRLLQKERQAYELELEGANARILVDAIKGAQSPIDVIRDNKEEVQELSNLYPELQDAVHGALEGVDLSEHEDLLNFIHLSRFEKLTIPGLLDNSIIHDKVLANSSNDELSPVFQFKTDYSITTGGESPMTMDFYPNKMLRSLKTWELNGKKWSVIDRYNFDSNGHPVNLTADQLQAYKALLEVAADPRVEVFPHANLSLTYGERPAPESPTPEPLHDAVIPYKNSKLLGYNQHGYVVYEDAAGRYFTDQESDRLENEDGSFDLTALPKDRIYRMGAPEAADFKAGDFLIARKNSDNYHDDLKAIAKGVVFESGSKPLEISDIKRYLQASTGEQEDNVEHYPEVRLIQEYIETAIIEETKKNAVKYPIEKLYKVSRQLLDNQASIDSRTASSIKNQQYSTPLPMAVALGDLINVGDYKTIVEPTVGNGALLTMVPYGVEITAFDLDETRVSNTKQLYPDAHVSKQDFTEVILPENAYDRAIMNPPFGGLNKKVKVQDGFSVERLDYLVAAKTLRALKENGRAAFIVGADNPMKGKPGELQGGSRYFYQWLHDCYSGVRVAEVDGSSFRKMGAGYPVRIVFVDGKGETPFNPDKALEVLKTPDDVFQWFKETKAELILRDENKIALAQEAHDENTATREEPKFEINDKGERFIGYNQNEVALYEDENGARFYFSNGFQISEPVLISPSHSGVGLVPPTLSKRLEDPFNEFVTEAELKETDQPERSFPAGNTPDITTDASYSVQLTESFIEKLSRPGAHDLATDPDTQSFIKEIREIREQIIRDHGVSTPDFLEKMKQLSIEQGLFKPNDFEKNLPNGDSVEGGVAAYAIYLADKFSQSLDSSRVLTQDNSQATLELEQELPDANSKESQTRVHTPSGTDKVDSTKIDGNLPDSFFEEVEPLPAKAEEQENQFLQSNEAQSFEPVDAEAIQQRSALETIVVNDAQARYIPLSKTGQSSFLVPINMAYYIAQAQSKFLQENGDIDEYVAKKLGYNVNELSKYFSPDQVDSIGFAIANNHRGRSFIIGDMTGVGKGRIVAGLIRYSIRQTGRAFFLTDKASLFTDILRDLKEIGTQSPEFFITNRDGSTIYNEDGSVYQKPDLKGIKKFEEQGELPDSAEIVCLTYSQINRQNAKKMPALVDAATGKGFLFDESHKAAGYGSNTNLNVRQLEAVSGFSAFSSATANKRASTMALYTPCFGGNFTEDALTQTLTSGGAPLLESVSNSLVQDGALLVRQHDLSNLDYLQHDNERSFEANKSLVDAVSEVTYRLALSSGEIKSIVQERDKEAKKANEKERMANPELGQAGVSSVSFGSRLFRLNRFVTFLSNLEETVHLTIESLEAGRKPVIAIEETGGSLLEKVLADNAVFDDVSGEQKLNSHPTLRDVFQNLLTSMRKVTVRTGWGESETVDAIELIKKGDYASDEAYLEAVKEEEEKIQALRDLIDEKIPPISASPLDYMIEKVQEAGYSIGEISGRTQRLVRNEFDNAYIVEKLNPVDGRVQRARDWNNGRMDAIILTIAGSAGISLHSSPSFDNQDQRELIVAQPPLDINDYLQFLGRVNRYRQVKDPMIRDVNNKMPSSFRLISMKNQKLGLQAASGQANRESKFSSKEIPDLMNRIGDEVCFDYLKNNIDDYETLLAAGFKQVDFEKREFDDLASRLTGMISLFPYQKQVDMYDKLTEEFSSKVEELERKGINPFATTVYDFKAETVNKELYEGIEKDTYDSVFEEPVYIEEIAYDEPIHPLSAKDVDERINEAENALQRMPLSEGNRNLEALSKYLDESRQGILERVKAKRFDSVEDALNDEKSNNVKIANETITTLMDALKDLRPGSLVNVLNPSTNELETSVVTHISLPPPDRALFTGGYRINTVSPGREPETITLHYLLKEGEVTSELFQNSPELQATFDTVEPGVHKRSRVVLSGNPLKAAEIAQKAHHGQVAFYTNQHGQRMMGVVMPEYIIADDLKKNGMTFYEPEVLSAYLKDPINKAWICSEAEGASSTASVIRHNERTNEWWLSVPGAKKHNEKIIDNENLLELLNEELSGDRSSMKARFNEDRLADVIQELANSKVYFTTKSPDAREWVKNYSKSQSEALKAKNEAEKKHKRRA